MKTFYCLMAAFTLAASAGADPNRAPWRSSGGVNVDLQPLFSWWTQVSQNPPDPGRTLDISEVNGDTLAAASNVWARLPARPLPDWQRILASESDITIAGNLWKINATIEPAPMMIKRETIYLRNPPVTEIQAFNSARATYEMLEHAQNADVSAEQQSESNILAQSLAVNQTNSPLYAPPGTAQGDANLRSLQLNSASTASNLISAHARNLARDTQLAPVEKVLANFPDKHVYWLDHFAVRTDERINGVAVYDLGTAAGLNY